MHVRLTQLMGLVVVGAMGCGGSVSKEDLSKEVIKALCSVYARCGAAKGEASCTALETDNLGSVFVTNQYDDSIAAGKIKYHGDRARKCLDAMAASSCSAGVFQTPNEDCYLTFEGTVAVGGTCKPNECVPTAFCSAEVDGQCPGTCKPKVAEGGATTGDPCANGLVVINGVCAKPAKEGAPCSEHSTSCDVGLICASDANVCKKVKLAGESCDATDTCSSLLNCVSGVCTAPGDVGAPCDQGSQTSLSCKVELTCDHSTATPVCKELPKEGEACESICADALACARASATATTSTCQRPVAVDQPCQAGACDKTLFCDDTSHVCKARVANGEPCTGADQCANGYCKGVSTTPGVCTSFTQTCP